jgi:DNA-3-methyladenine glycosylase II
VPDGLPGLPDASEAELAPANGRKRRLAAKETAATASGTKELLPGCIDAAVQHLRSVDPVMRELIDAVGSCVLEVQQDRFGQLVETIIHQKISFRAARRIHASLLDRLGPEGLTPAGLANFSAEQLRHAGLSRQKASYMADLAAKVNAGTLDLQAIERLTDEQVISTLREVKGIGEWSAQMFLILALGRPDVFPHGDLGVRKALQRWCQLADRPDKDTSLALAARWRPYASIATWYLYRSQEHNVAPKGTQVPTPTQQPVPT